MKKLLRSRKEVLDICDIHGIVELSEFKDHMVFPLFTEEDVQKEIIKISMGYKSSMRKEAYYDLAELLRAPGRITRERISKELDFITKWAKEGHISPFKHGNLSFDVNLSLNAFGHLVKHQTFMPMNTMSLRYCDMSDSALFLYDDIILEKNQTDRTTMSFSDGEDMTDEQQEYYYRFMFSVHATVDAYNECMEHLQEGFPSMSKTAMQETCRSLLPTCTITKTMVTPSMLALCNMIGQRLSPHAQTEIRIVVSNMVNEIANVNEQFADVIKLVAKSINNHTLKDNELLSEL